MADTNDDLAKLMRELEAAGLVDADPSAPAVRPAGGKPPVPAAPGSPPAGRPPAGVTERLRGGAPRAALLAALAGLLVALVFGPLPFVSGIDGGLGAALAVFVVVLAARARGR